MATDRSRMSPELRDELARIKSEKKADGKPFFDWDINVAAGELAENELKDILTGGVTVEVKRDFRVSESGNVAIEIHDGTKPSGIMATKAKYWAIVLDGPEYEGGVIAFVETARLRCIADMVKWEVLGGQGKRSRMKLVPVRMLFYKGSRLKCEAAETTEH